VSPDARTVLVVNNDGKAQLWDALTQKPVGKLWSHQGPVLVAFSSDGRKVATVQETDGAGTLRDAANGKALGPPLPAHGSVKKLALSDKHLLTIGTDQLLRVCEAATG